MKAIKYSTVLFLISIAMVACDTKKQATQSLDPTTKDYFEVKDGSTFTFVNVSDTNAEIVYTSSGYFSTKATLI
jgi:hypothetical protein